MKNYAKPLPRDKDMGQMQEYAAPFKSLARSAAENSSASSVITLSQDTTAVEVAAVGGAAVVRWITTADTEASVISAAGTANFDHVVPTNTLRRFVIPIESMPATGYGSVQGANRENGLYRRVAIKSVGVASVLTSEF